MTAVEFCNMFPDILDKKVYKTEKYSYIMVDSDNIYYLFSKFKNLYINKFTLNVLTNIEANTLGEVITKMSLTYDEVSKEKLYELTFLNIAYLKKNGFITTDIKISDSKNFDNEL